ncbi:MAG: hypothetical protein QM817_32555 [Archangium sp.]
MTTPRYFAVFAVMLSAEAAFAQNPPPGGTNPNEWSAPPMTGAPVAKAVVPAGDVVGTGMQFHGEISGGTAGFGGSASFGIGFNRVAILFTPAITLTGANTAVFTTSIEVSVRIYLKQRAAGALVGYLHPGAGLLVSTAGGSGLGLGGTVGFGAGAEYLLTKNLGFNVELGLRLSGTSAGINTTTGLFGINTAGTVGIVLHT